MTRETFGKIITILGETYGVEFSDQRRQVWWQLLQDMPDEEAQQATVHVCRTSSYPPKPADLLTAVRGKDADQVEELAAIGEAHLQVHLCDYRINDFGPLLNAVLRDMGGVDAVLALMDTGQWRFERPRFKALLSAYTRRGVSDEAGAPLVPQVVGEGLRQFPLETYTEHGIALPVVRALFGGTPARKSLPAP